VTELLQLVMHKESTKAQSCTCVGVDDSLERGELVCAGLRLKSLVRAGLILGLERVETGQKYEIFTEAWKSLAWTGVRD